MRRSTFSILSNFMDGIPYISRPPARSALAPITKKILCNTCSATHVNPKKYIKIADYYRPPQVWWSHRIPSLAVFFHLAFPRLPPDALHGSAAARPPALLGHYQWYTHGGPFGLLVVEAGSNPGRWQTGANWICWYLHKVLKASLAILLGHPWRWGRCVVCLRNFGCPLASFLEEIDFERMNFAGSFSTFRLGKAILDNGQLRGPHRKGRWFLNKTHECTFVCYTYSAYIRICAYVIPKTRVIILCLYFVYAKKSEKVIKRDVQQQNGILLLLLMI